MSSTIFFRRKLPEKDYFVWICWIEPENFIWQRDGASPDSNLFVPEWLNMLTKMYKKNKMYMYKIPRGVGTYVTFV